jgi:hypothetical protein
MVVREEPGGWLAIEPPDESFSWIAGEYVRAITDTEGEVIANDVLVRIGTPIDARQKDAWQKKLNKGDRVMILEKTTSGEGGLAKVHYKIVPPPGEVRYVRAQYVQPVSGRRPSQRAGSQSPSSSSRPPPRDLGTDEPAPHSRGTIPGDSQEDSEEPEQAPAARAAARAPRNPLERANAAYQAMMLRTLPDRDIAGVRTLYEQAAEAAKTDAEHALIADRLESLQYQEGRQAKFMEFDRAVRRSRQRDEALLSIPRRKTNESAESEPGQTQSSPRYDGSGTLRRSTAVIDGKPAYVLLSPQGGIRYYVSPSPGIDLNRYLDRVIAVRGPSSYRMEVRAQHITVRDVTVIELNQSELRDAKLDRGSRRS